MFVVKIETTKDVYSDMLKQKEFFDNVKLYKNKTYADFYVNLGSMNLNPSDSDIRKEFNNILGTMRKRPTIKEIKPFEIKEDEMKEEKKGDKDIVREEKDGDKDKDEKEVKEEEEKKSVFIIRQLKSKISNLESRLKTANKKIEQKDREIENYKKENTRIFDQLITAQNTIGKLKTELGNERLRFNMEHEKNKGGYKNREKKILLTNKEDWNTVFPEEDMDKACSICYENKKSHVFNCGHFFCGKCVKESVLDQDKNKCPLCQVEINSIIRILDYYD